MICPNCNFDLSAKKMALYNVFFDCIDCSVRFFYYGKEPKFNSLYFQSDEFGECSISSSGLVIVSDTMYNINSISDHHQAFKTINKYIDNMCFA